jgi:hypothetical protein
LFDNATTCANRQPHPLRQRPQGHALDAGVARQQLQESQDEVAQLRLTNSLVQSEGDRRLVEARVEVEELRRHVEMARSELSAIQARQGGLRAGKGVLGRVSCGPCRRTDVSQCRVALRSSILMRPVRDSG